MKLILVSICFFAITACKKESCAHGVNAIFKDLTELDGCGIVIELENGTRLEPVNLGDFPLTAKDGMKIRVQYHSVTAGSICMVGEMVEIDCLAKR